MQNITFDFPTRLFLGKKVLSRVGRVVSLANYTRVLLIFGQGSIKKNGVYQAVVDSLEKHGIFWTEYWGIASNPECGQIEELVAAAKALQAGAFVPVGGGSVIDAAKLAAASLAAGTAPWDLVASGKDILFAHPVYAVCTCSGAGTEASCSAIVTNPALRRKTGVKGPALWPQAAFIDPRVQYSLSWLQTLAGGMDAFAHCLEHYISGVAAPQPFEMSLRLCETLMRGLLDALQALQQDRENYAARASLAWASLLAVNGIAGSGLGGGDWTLHLAAHALGAYFPHIPHGLAVAALLPGWIEILKKEYASSGIARLERIVFGEEGSRASVRSFTELNELFSCPRLRIFGVTAADVPTVAAAAQAAAQEHHGSQRCFSLDSSVFSRVLQRAV